MVRFEFFTKGGARAEFAFVEVKPTATPATPEPGSAALEATPATPANPEPGSAVLEASPAEPTATPLARLAKARSKFTGKSGETFYLPKAEEASELLVGLGEPGKVTAETLRKAAFSLAKALKEHKESEVEVALPELAAISVTEVFQAFAEGFLHSDYRFSRKTMDKNDGDDNGKDLTVRISAAAEEAELQAALANVNAMMEGIFLARDLTNRTANEIYPETLARAAQEALEPAGVKVRVYDKAEIEAIGMEAFLSVAKGSAHEPRFIVMEYNGQPDSAERTALVGKGLTYDSGGYSIKTAAGMVTMHCDMAGSAAVIGTLLALAKAQAKSNVVGVVAACENLISGTAFKTGDIIGSLSGKTIEVLNTDAEGRLTLADAIYYATNQLDADRVIDLATLTGACVVALGSEYTAAVTNDDAFMAELKAAADVAGEKVWQLPSDEAFAEKNKSKVADLLNSPGREAGTVTAGLFVGEFLAKDVPWIHLDIAGTAYRDKPSGYLPDRATGQPVKTLFTLLNPRNS